VSRAQYRMVEHMAALIDENDLAGAAAEMI
jgi:hypothetical protein